MDCIMRYVFSLRAFKQMDARTRAHIHCLFYTYTLLWPHLRSLADNWPPLQDCDVGLLIGYDWQAAIAPREVILGDENQPFAQR